MNTFTIITTSYHTSTAVWGSGRCYGNKLDVLFSTFLFYINLYKHLLLNTDGFSLSYCCIYVFFFLVLKTRVKGCCFFNPSTLAALDSCQDFAPKPRSEFRMVVLRHIQNAHDWSIETSVIICSAPSPSPFNH